MKLHGSISWQVNIIILRIMDKCNYSVFQHNEHPTNEGGHCRLCKNRQITIAFNSCEGEISQVTELLKCSTIPPHIYYFDQTL